MPLCKFVEVLVNRDYSALVIVGNPTDAELEQAWADIYSEFIDLVGDSGNKQYNLLLKNITILKLTLSQIETLVDILTELIDAGIHYPPYTSKLNALLNTKFNFEPQNPEEYKKLLKRCWNRRSGIVIEIGLRERDIEDLEEKNKNKGQRYSYQYFQSALIALSDHAKYSIQDTISVYEFGQRLQKLFAYNDSLTKKH